MSVFGWCSIGEHEKCHRKYRPFIIDPKTNKVVYLKGERTCECKQKGCLCNDV